MRDSDQSFFRRFLGERLANLLTSRSARLSVGRVGGGIISASWLIIMARSLDPISFSTVILVLTLAFLTSIIHDGGQCVALAKSVSLHPEMTRELLFVVLRRRVVLASVGLLLISLVFRIISEAPLLNILLVFPSVLCTVGYTTIFAVLRVQNSIKLETRNEIFSRLIMLMVGLSLLPWGLSTYTVILLYSLADLATFLIVWKNYSHLLRNPSRQKIEQLVRKQLKLQSGLLLALTSAVGLLVSRIDPLLVAALSSDNEVSFFAIGSRFVEFSLVPIGAAVVMSIPKFSGADNPEGLLTAAKEMAVYGVGVALLLQVIAVSLPILFGAQYESAIFPFRILTFSVVATSFGALLLNWLTLNKPLLALCCVILGLVSSIFAHSILTSDLGATGAAISSASANLVIAAASFLSVVFVARSFRNV